MLKSKLRYIMTWVTFGMLLTSGLGLMIVSWNGIISGFLSPSLMVLLWISMSASGIYLFMLAVKKAHRLWIDEQRRKKLLETRQGKSSSPAKSSTKEKQALDIASTARKLVRRIPDDLPLESSAQVLLKNLAKELEIMSGIVYVREKNTFKSVATFALVSSLKPYSFNEGEGITGQVAANQQIMVLTRLPEEHLEVYSGLGKSEPTYLAIVPLVQNNRTVAVLECTGYRYDPHDIESMFRIFARDLMAKISSDHKK